MLGMATNKKTRGRPPKYPKSDTQDRSVKRLQVSMRHEIFNALEAFRTSQEFELERSAIIEKLVERFLVEKGYYSPEK